MLRITNRRGQFVEIDRDDLRALIRRSIYERRRVSERQYVRSLRAVICRVKGELFSREARQAERLRESAKPIAQRNLERRPHGPEIIDMVPARCRKSYIYLQLTYPGKNPRWRKPQRDLRD